MPSLLFIYPINCNRLSMRCVIDAPALRFNVQAVQRFTAGEMPKQYLPIYRISKLTRIASSSIGLRYVATGQAVQCLTVTIT